MPISKADIIEIFTYHKPNDMQQKQYEAIRTCAREFAEIIVENTPSSPDQTAAIRLLRQVVMTANASIALNGKY